MTKKALLASAAVLALGLGYTSSAKAFDVVDWSWDKDVLESVSKTVNINIDISPTGMTEIEKIQMNIGNITAEAQLNDFANNAAGESDDGSAVVVIDEVVTIQNTYDKPIVGVGQTQDASTTNVVDDGDTSGLTITAENAQLSNQQNALGHGVDVRISGEVKVALEDLAKDAIDLPKVENIATAVANNQSIESSVGVQLHDAQYNWGGFNVVTDETSVPQEALQGFAGAWNATGNTHTNLLLSAGLAAALGVITQGDVSATAVVDSDLPGSEGNLSVLNASVANSATAVGNNLSVALEASTPDDALLIADLTQFNYANVNAYAEVDDVAINGYTNFGGAGFGNCGGCLEGEPQVPVISNIATAVGNNVSIKVSSPEAGGVVIP